MGKKRHTIATIAVKLWKANVLLAKRQMIEEVIRQLGISDAR
jgi:hypothetical protein